MQARALLLPLVLLAVPLAAATYGEGSTIEADPPVALDGRVDTWLPAGIASYVGSGATQPFVVRLDAGESTVTVRTIEIACAGLSIPGAPCQDPQPRITDVEYRMRDLALSSTKPLTSYKVLATTDRGYADTQTFGESGRILVTTAAGTRLDTNRDAVHLSPMDGNWNADSNALEPVYDAEALSAMLTTSAPAVLQATGGFETFLQGLRVSIQGESDDGPVDETIDTSMPTDENGPWKMVIVEVEDGELQASGTATFVGYAPSDQRPVSDVHSSATFTRATGTIVESGRSDRTLANEGVTLDGPLSLTLTKITSGSAPRLSFTLVDGLALAGLDEPAEDEPIPPAALAAAGAAGAGGAGALIALAYFWPRLKLWATLLFLPMYTRIERDAVLEHEKRDELYELIRVTPGIHAHEIGTKANIGWGTTVYHLKLLENHGLIVSKKSGRYKRFFVNTGEYTKKKDIYGALRNETAKAVAQYVVDHPGTTQKDLCAALGIQPSLASWHVEKLEGVELVKRVKDGRMVRYFAGPAWADLNVRVNPAVPGADTPAET